VKVIKMTESVKLKTGKKATHGGYTFLSTGRLPEHRREVERYLTAARQGLIGDLAGTEEALTTAQVIIIDRVIGKLGILRCIEEFIREHTVFVKDELAPCLKASYLAYGNSIRLDLQALGINTRAGERILGPLEIAEQIDAEQAEKEAREAEKAAQAGGLEATVPQGRLSPEDSPATTGNSDDTPGGEKLDIGEDNENDD
jgi:hypothetical protein